MPKAAHWTVSGARDLPIAQASAWDGNTAAKALLDHAGIGTDHPDHVLASRGFVFTDAANPDDRAGYKDPFAVVEGGTLKASSAGIRALESFVPRTDVPAELKKSAAALVAHYKDRMDGATARASAVICAALPAADGKAPAWIQLFPKGEVKPRDGRKGWTLSDPEGVIAASQLPAPIDYDHGAARAVDDGQNSRAAGWIEELAAHGPNGEPGLWARVEWTEAGAQAVAAKEYRFISPWFLHSKASGEITKVMGAGLVNTPALDLPALASIQELEEGNSVDELMTKLRAALNLPDNASADDVVSAITAMRSNSNALCAAAGITQLGDTEVAAICARLKNPARDPSQQKQIDDLQKEVATLTATMRGNTASAEVDGAIKAGKLAPAQRDWAIGYASRDPDGFKTFAGKQPVILATGRIASEAAPEGSLTDEEKAICSALQLTEDQYKAEKARQAKAH